MSRTGGSATPQEAPEILFLPLLRFSVVFEATLSFAKRTGVVVTATVSDDGGHVVVKHFVKDDRFDEKPGDPRLVENGVDADQPLFREIGPKLERALPSVGLNASTPRDEHVDLAPEMATAELGDDLREIVMTARRAQGVFRRTGCDEPAPVRIDEAIDPSGGEGIAIAQILAHGIQDVLVGGEEHVMQSHLEPPAFGACGQHRAPVVGDDQADRLTEPLREHSAPRGRPRVSSIEIVPSIVPRAAVRDRRCLGGKLEGKLKHAISG